METNPDYSETEFPVDSTTAEKRFQDFHIHDPFPEIPPALLNEMDIHNYARVTGMVIPFEQDQRVLKEKLKFASYEIDFLGEVHYIDEQDQSYKIEIIEKGTPYPLKKNSIAFIYLKTEFRLPYYIAIRFNLRITHVHRGLLLGTGPLVDPGFKGRLLIPLHNLTSSDYTLIGGEGLIWVEFTKLSPHPLWNKELPVIGKRALAEARPHRKMDFSAQQFFLAATNGRPAKSSIPGEVTQARTIAEKAQKRANFFGVGIIISGVVGLIPIIYMTWDLIQSANNNVGNASIAITNFRDEQFKFQKRIDDLEAEVKRLRAPKPSSGKQSATKPQQNDRADTQLRISPQPTVEKAPAGNLKENH